MKQERTLDDYLWARALRAARERRAGQKKRIENFLASASGNIPSIAQQGGLHTCPTIGTNFADSS